MDKQQRLNLFLKETCVFIEKYYSSSITDISFEPEEEWVKVVITGENDSVCKIYSDGEEIIIMFGESHWHIDNYSEPCDYSKIYENTIDSILELLKGELVTYSCWIGGETIGGSSFLKSEVSDITKELSGFFKNTDIVHIKSWNEELIKTAVK
ncbi:MAG: hypothetical protein KAH22_09635 [Thiotrichaceae bacterium]|nr:hypothetical protein [Thiotrichaceae bacterium]